MKATITMNKKVNIITKNENGSGVISVIDYKKFNEMNIDFEEITVKISLNKNTYSKLNKLLDRGYVIIDEMKGHGFEDLEIFRKLKKVS